MYNRIVGIWLTIILVIMPVQYTLGQYLAKWNLTFAAFWTRLDDYTIILSSVLALIEYVRRKSFTGLIHLSWILPITLFMCSGMISHYINGNDLIVTAEGLYHYVKYFLIIFIYAAFFRKFDDFEKTFRILLAVAVIIGIVAMAEEAWALVSKYILTESMSDKYYFYSNVLTENRWRFRIYRTPSIMGHYNKLGLYSLLFFTMYLINSKKINIKVLLCLISGVLLSMSRSVYIAGLVLIAAQIFRRRRRKVVLAMMIPVSIAVLYMSTLSDFNLASYLSRGDLSTYSGRIPFRTYAFNKAMDVWGDHPMFGVGPGMFGSGVALKYNTYVYEEYNFRAIMGGLDQFWPQILAETGIVGSALYLVLIISLLITFMWLRKNVGDYRLSNYFVGLSIYLVMMFFYSIGNRLDVIEPVFFSYMAFVGIGIGCAEGEVGGGHPSTLR